nr:hypothetical protein [Tanacetum cinerariifolium]
VTESSVRKDLRLADEEGIDCLLNSTIFEQFALMRKPKRNNTQVPQPSDPIENVADEAVHKELGDSLVRAATTASSLEAEHDNSNINKTQSKETPNESSSQGPNSDEEITMVSVQDDVDKEMFDMNVLGGEEPKKKDQIRLDEEVALKLQAEFDEEEIITREKAKKEERANIALIETWDDIQAKIDVDHQLAERLQA